jgi:hypothetical protein
MDVGVLAHGMFVWPKFPTSTSSPTCTYCGEVWLYDDFDRWLARNEAELAEEEDEADGTP